jgi:hypothetical protein
VSNISRRGLPILFKLHQGKKKGGTLVSVEIIALTPRLLKDYPRHECRVISCVNMDVKILNKILANQIQKSIFKRMHQDQELFISEI